MPTADSFAAAWALVASALGEHAVNPPPPPTPALWREVAAGRVGRVTSGTRGVTGFGYLAEPRERVWLSLTDDHLDDDVQGLDDVILDGGWASPKLLYQRLDLPWPVTDRHWVLRTANNAALARAAGVWERSWALDDTRLGEARARTDAAAFDAAITMRTNHGSWILLAHEGGTLAVYEAWADLGGNVPAEAADAYSRSSLDGVFRGVAAHVADVVARYGPGCNPQPGADGAPIACFGG